MFLKISIKEVMDDCQGHLNVYAHLHCLDSEISNIDQYRNSLISAIANMIPIYCASLMVLHLFSCNHILSWLVWPQQGAFSVTPIIICLCGRHLLGARTCAKKSWVTTSPRSLPSKPSSYKCSPSQSRRTCLAQVCIWVRLWC